MESIITLCEIIEQEHEEYMDLIAECCLRGDSLTEAEETAYDLFLRPEPLSDTDNTYELLATLSETGL